MSMNANLPEYLHGRQGYMMLDKLSVTSLDKEQYSIFNAVTDDGYNLSQEDCEKMLLNGGVEVGTCIVPDSIRTILEQDILQHTKSKLASIDNRNLVMARQEEDRIYAWERDMLDGIEQELSSVKKAIQQAERDSRNATSVAEKQELLRKADELNRKKRRLRNELEDREDEIAAQRKNMIEELERRIVQSSDYETLFIIHWKIK